MGRNWKTFRDETFDFCQGITLHHLPGHTDGLVGMQINLLHMGTYFFISDHCHVIENVRCRFPAEHRLLVGGSALTLATVAGRHPSRLAGARPSIMVQKHSASQASRADYQGSDYPGTRQGDVFEARSASNSIHMRTITIHLGINLSLKIMISSNTVDVQCISYIGNSNLRYAISDRTGPILECFFSRRCGSPYIFHQTSPSRSRIDNRYRSSSGGGSVELANSQIKTWIHRHRLSGPGPSTSHCVR